MKITRDSLDFPSKMKIFKVSDKSLNELTKAGINDLNDLRKNRTKLGKLNLSKKDTNRLKRASFLSLLTNNEKVLNKLNTDHYNSIKDLSKLTIDNIVKLSNGDLSKKQAKEFVNKVNGLNNLIKLNSIQFRTRLRNRLSTLSSKQFIDSTELRIYDDLVSVYKEDCLNCDESNNLLSPAAYLLYLLDFVEKSFGNKLNSLKNINDRFFQKFEELPISQDISNKGSYLEYSNTILVNMISDMLSKPWPDTVSDPAVGIFIKSIIYNKFKESPIFDSTLIIDLFDSYVKQFGITRRDVFFNSKGSDSLKSNFKKENDLIQEDIEAIDKRDNDIKLTDVNLLRENLYNYYLRKTEISLKEEYISDIADEKLKEFSKYYNNLKKNKYDEVALSLIEALPSGLTSYQIDSALEKSHSRAKYCVQLGFGCPETGVGSEFNEKSINPILELFRHYIGYFSNAILIDTNQVADSLMIVLYETLKQKQYDILMSTEIINPLAPNYDSSVAADNEKEAEEYAFNRLYTEIEEEFDNQLNKLAKLVFEKEISIPINLITFIHKDSLLANENWKYAVSKAELGFLSKIRHNLIILALKIYKDNNESDFLIAGFDPVNLGSDTNIEKLADFLHLDLTVGEDYKTTPLSLAINRMHSFVQHDRLWNEIDNYNLDEFDKNTWGWLKSYGTWHAAMMVTMYPENYLFSDLRYNQSPEFKELLDSLDVGENVDSSALHFQNSLNNYSRSGSIFATTRLDDMLFIFRNGQDGLYYSVKKKNDEWQFFKKLSSIPIIFDEETGDKKYIDNIIPERYGSTDQGYSYFLRFLAWQKVDGYETLHHISLKLEGDSIVNDSSIQWEPINEVKKPSEYPWNESSSIWRYNFGISKVFSYDRGDRNEYPSSNDIRLHAFIIGRETYVPEKFGEKRAWEIKLLPNGGLEVIRELSPDDSSLFCGNYDFVMTDPTGYRTLWKDVRSSTFYLMGGNIEDKLPYYYRKISGSINTPNNLKNTLQPYLLTNITSVNAIALPDDFSAIKTTHIWHNNNKLTKINHDRYFEGIESTEQIVDNINIYTPKALIFANDYEYFFGNYDNNFGYYKNYKYQDPSFDLFHVLSAPKFCENCQNNIYTHNEKTVVDFPVPIYLKEYYLYMPLVIAEYLNEKQQYRKAFKYLSRIYDPLDQSDLFTTNVPDFLTELAESHYVSRWHKEPFNPFLLADLNKESYQTKVKFAHVNNILDWADQWFTQDTPESVNRARELYELALEMLRPYEVADDTCAVDTIKFLNELHTNSSTPISQPFKEAYIEWKINNTIGSRNSSSILNILINQINNYQSNYEDEMLDQNINSTLDEIPDYVVEQLGNVDIGEEIPELKPFCMPLNPMVKLLRWRIESNLYKISSNRNISGFKRDLQPYATPVDPSKMVHLAASGNLDFEQFIPITPPPVYRYSFLLEQSKYLISVAHQLESSMISSLEKEDIESYSYMRAKQDLSLEKSNVGLHNLRLNESYHSKDLAEAQVSRANFQFDHYDKLIDVGYSGWEEAALGTQAGAASAYAVGAVAGGIGSYFGGGNTAEVIATIAMATGSAASATSSIFSMTASFERRAAEWNFQKELAGEDINIANIGIDLADDRLKITEKENVIARLRQDHASNVIEFLGNKFTNKELYRWMNTNLKKLYREQLNYAISTSKATQRAFEFERQSTYDFINYDYWDSDKKGILAAEQLLNDLNKMDQFRLKSASRKKEIEKTISLASVAPLAFQKFRETGVFDFETMSQWFDRDFPGHYMRLIRDVNVSVLALIPPYEGVHATLSNNGLSYIVPGPPYEEHSVIYRLPESIALSRAQNATGLFDLRPDDPMLLPFEGSGVITNWRLEMSKGANRFDYSTIFDVLFTIRYTALEDRSYRDKILDELGQDEDGYVQTQSVRYFSLRNEFPDQWYHLFNPSIESDTLDYYDPFKNYLPDSNIEEKTIKPYTLLFDILDDYFPHNEELHKIKNVTLAVQKSDKLRDEEKTIDFNLKFIPNRGSEVSCRTLVTSEDTYQTMSDMNGKRPFGKWVIQVDYSYSDLNDIDVEWLDDIFLVIDYKSSVHYNR
jgi:hypothetical protein